MSLLSRRVEYMKEYSRFAGLAQESEAREDWREAMLLWGKAAAAGQQINHSGDAIERANACFHRYKNPVAVLKKHK